MDVFDAWGYARIITPMFEHADVLERGLGEAARATAIRFVEPGTGEIVALRPDITPQIARIVATRMADVPGPIRLCYEGAVMRLAGERGQREILQAGIELVDPGRLTNAYDDAEVLGVAAAVLAVLGLAETRLEVGHVAPAKFVLDSAPDVDARDRLVAAISRKDRAGTRAAARALPPEVAPLAEALVKLYGPARETLAHARAIAGWPDGVLAAFAHLTHLPLEHASIDFSDLRGFDYYTGIKLAAYASGAPDAILRGGRYDELIARYGRPAHAIGFALDLEAVAEALHEQPRGKLGVVESLSEAVARDLRAAGFRTVYDPSPVDAAWLRGAGFDVAISLDGVVRADGRPVDAREQIHAAVAGDTKPLIALLRG